MAASCLTVEEILQAAPEFNTFGPASSGTLTILSVGAPGDTLTFAGVTLTAVAGARTSGSDDFSLASATVPGVAQSILDALADPLNSFTTILTAIVQIPGVPTVLALTSVTTGYYSTIPIASSDALVYELSGATLLGGEVLITTITDSTCQMQGDCWGVKKSWGHLYLAAHFATLAAGGAGGPVTSRSIDKISESFAPTPFAQTDAALSSTKWGIMYLALRKTLPNLGIVVGRSNLGLIGVVGGGCC